MFVSVTRAEFKKDRMQEVRDEIAKLAGAMTKLEGYRGTETLRDVNDETAYLFLLRWDNEQAWKAYRDSDLYRQEVVKQFEPLANVFRAVGHYQLIES